MSDKCVFIKIKGMTYMEYELYYKKPVDDVQLKKATVFNNKHIYWLMTENGRQSRLGNFKRLATYHSGRREDDYDYDMYEFTEGDVLAENSKYIYCVHKSETEPTKKKYATSGTYEIFILSGLLYYCCWFSISCYFSCFFSYSSLLNNRFILATSGFFSSRWKSL